MVSRRHLVIAGGVVLFHVVALWALQAGLVRRAVEVLVPVAVLSEFMNPPRPQVEPPPLAPKVVPQPASRQAKSLTPPPMPLPIADSTPAPHASAGVVTESTAQPLVAAPIPAAPPPPKVDLPSSNADYLQNPKPAYPAMSKRLGEQGKVVVRVLIGVDGVAQKAEIRHSSGFDRLDQAAWTTAQRWRYVPGKRGGVPEAMWVNVPFNFVLE